MEASQTQQYTPQNQAPAPQVQAVAPPPPRSSNKKIIILFLLLAVVLIIVALVAMALRGKINLPISNQGVEITWWGFWEDDSIVQPLLAQYKQMHPNVTINYVKQSKEDYRERLTNAMARGNAPDIFKIHNSWVPMFGQELATLPEEVLSSADYSNTFFPVAVESLTTNKGIVGIPLQYDGLGLFINQDIFNTFGKAVPNTWNELRQTAIDLTLKDEDGLINQAGVALGSTENIDHWEEIIGLMSLQNGANFLDPQGAPASGALRYFLQFKLTDKVWDDSQPQSTLAFATGKVAMYFGPSWRAEEIKTRNPNLRFKVYPVPQLPKLSEEEPDVSYASFWTEAVWERSKVKNEAWEFLKFISSSDSLSRIHANAVKSTKTVPEPYPRQDMRSLLLADPLVGGIIDLAPSSRSSYLASFTSDGETGINTLLANAYKKVLDSARQNVNSNQIDNQLPDLSIEVRTILSKYGLVPPPVIPTR